MSIHIGQASLNVGDSLWQQYATEHGLDLSSGARLADADDCLTPNDNVHSVFDETQHGFKPRAIAVSAADDCDATALGNAQWVAADDDSEGVWAKGYYGTYAGLKDRLLDAVRQQTEKCDRLDSVLVYCSTGGGTGSGVVTRLVEDMRLVAHLLVPNVDRCSNPLEYYNAVLTLPSMVTNSCTAVLADNYAAHGVASKHGLDTHNDFLADVNEVLCRAYANITAPARFGRAESISKFVMNLNDYPRNALLVPTFSSFARSEIEHDQRFVNDMFTDSFRRSNSLLATADPVYRVLSSQLFIRGTISQYQATEAQKH